MEKVIVLGAGVSGLAIGYASQQPVYEANPFPGGICASYYVAPSNNRRMLTAPPDQEAYRFEFGGGHWLFGDDPYVLRFTQSFVSLKGYNRRASVYFRRWNLFVPYPIQNHLAWLGEGIASQALKEITRNAMRPREPVSMADWLILSFGKTLTDLFFGPFHERYTAGLWVRVAPQDAYKSPVNLDLIVEGATKRTDAGNRVGYNPTFVYPPEGLDVLVRRVAEKCHVNYSKRVVRIDVKRKEVLFEDGTGARYDVLISTLPLNRMVELTGLQVDAKPDPYTSVLVLNIGAEKGVNCPNDHWVYVPDSYSGFYRVGFYSNVDASFLPSSARSNNNRVSVYVERAFYGNTALTEQKIKTYAEAVVRELQEWGWIGRVEVIDPTWVETAYTWSWVGSQWREQAINLLKQHDIIPVGRYAEWRFQGIVESLRNGLLAGVVWSKAR